MSLESKTRVVHASKASDGIEICVFIRPPQEEASIDIETSKSTLPSRKLTSPVPVPNPQILQTWGLGLSLESHWPEGRI